MTCLHVTYIFRNETARHRFLKCWITGFINVWAAYIRIVKFLLDTIVFLLLNMLVFINLLLSFLKDVSILIQNIETRIEVIITIVKVVVCCWVLILPAKELLKIWKSVKYDRNRRHYCTTSNYLTYCNSKNETSYIVFSLIHKWPCVFLDRERERILPDLAAMANRRAK